MNPMATSFLLPTPFPGITTWVLSSELCGHIPSPDELIPAPFYQDPS